VVVEAVGDVVGGGRAGRRAGEPDARGVDAEAAGVAPQEADGGEGVVGRRRLRAAEHRGRQRVDQRSHASRRLRPRADQAVVDAGGDDAAGGQRAGDADEAALPAVVSLRPGIFMENFLLSTAMIAKAGQIFTPLPAGKRWPLVATTDIAAKAACWLLDRSWSGHHRIGVHGPKDLSTDEAAAIISSVLGKPVKCVETTIDQARGALTGMGMPDFIVEIILEMYVAFREGRLDQAEPRTPDTTTPTSLAEFARTTLVPAIHNVSSAASQS